MKKVLSFAFAVLFACLAVVPCFASWNGKVYKLVKPASFTEISSDNNEYIWENKKTKSTIDTILSLNGGRLFYVGADHEKQKSFTDDFISKLVEAANANTEGKDYTVSYNNVEFEEKKFEHVSGFEITAETTKKSVDGSSTVVFDSAFYFFSTKDIVVKIQCTLLSDEDKEAVEEMLNEFEFEDEYLTADNVSDSLPPYWTAIIPVAVIALVVVLVVVLKKRRSKPGSAEA